VSECTGAEPRLVIYRGKWCIYENRRRLATGATTRVDAERFLANLKAEIAKPSRSSQNLASLLDAYLADRRKREKPGAERLAWAHKQLKAKMGHLPTDGVTEDITLDYTAARRAEGIAERTIRTELEALRAGLRNAGIAPTIAFPSKVGTARERWLTHEEADRLLAKCEYRHLRLAVVVALHTTARIGSVLSLTWDRVDLEARRIDFRTPGEILTKKRRTMVPINGKLYEALVEAKGHSTCKFVIEYSGSKVASIRHGFAAASKRAGLGAGVSPHTTRHTGITWMLQKGVSPWEVSQLAGVSLEVIQSTYGHHCPNFLIGAVEALGA
jgi:integrase